MKKNNFLTEDESARCETMVAPYAEKVKLILKEAFEDPQFNESAKGVLISGILINMINILKINLSRQDFDLTISSMLRAIGIENWTQKTYN